MKNRALLVLAALVAVSVATVACGGAIDSPSSSSSSSSSSSGSSGPGPVPTTTSTTPLPPPGPLPPPKPTPGPTTFYGSWSATASGCANFTVFAADTSNPRYLVINASKTELGLGAIGSTATVNLANPSTAPSTSIAVDAYSSAPAQPYCTDIGPTQPSFHGRAFQGTVTFTVTSVGTDGTYSITVALHGVAADSPYGELEPIPDITYTNVSVGWLPG